MTNPVQTLSSSPSVPVAEKSFSAKLKPLVQVVVQMAVRIFFVMSSVLLAASTLPLHLHVTILPAVAVGTALLAGFFFPNRNSAQGPYFSELPPLIQPAFPQSELPDEAPRGLKNTGNNCSINSVVHFLLSDPQIVDWLRNSLKPDIELPALENFLTAYRAPAQFMESFRARVRPLPPDVEGPARPPAPLLETFNDFLDGYVPEPEEVKSFGDFREIYKNFVLIQNTFKNFMAAYDEAVQEKKPVGKGDSQVLRLALHQIMNDINPGSVQIDAHEVLQIILGQFPDSQRLKFEEVRHYEPVEAGAPEVADLTSRRDFSDCLTLEFTENEAAPKLVEMFDRWLNDYNMDKDAKVKREGIDGQIRDYKPTHCARTILEPPAALHFEIKRFKERPPAKSWLTQLHSWLWPEQAWAAAKIATPVEIPNELTVAGQVYRLASFVNHEGASAGHGHYTATRIIHGTPYVINDRIVTPVDQETAKVRAQQAYLLCYVR